MKPRKKENRKFRKWMKKAGIILAVLFLAPVFLFTVGWFNRDFLIDELQDWYNSNNNGKLEIGQVNATFLEGFPNVGFTIKDIYQSSLDTILDKRSSIFINEARVSIGASDLLKGRARFRNIEIDKAEIISEVVTEKSVEEYKELKQEKQRDPDHQLEFPGWLNTVRTNFRLRDISFISKDSMLNKYFNLEVYDAVGKIRKNGEQLIGDLDFEVLVRDLGFNTKKGSYINGAVIKGNPHFVLNKARNLLKIQDFPLKIGDQVFRTRANFDFDGINAFEFSFANPETNFTQTRELLPHSMAAKISSYEFDQPLQTNFNLKGQFLYGDVPHINANFSTVGNRIEIGDSIYLDEVTIIAHLTNGLHEDKTKKPGKKDLKINFEEFSARLDDIQIAASESYFQSSEEALNYIQANLKMSGSNETLARTLQADNFSFIGGSFNLDTQISGDINTPPEILDHSIGKFSLENTRVVLKKNKLQLPVEILEMKLGEESAVLEQLKINLPNGENLIFKGSVKNFSSLLMNDPVKPATTDVSLVSEELNINYLLTTAMEFVPAQENKNNQYNTLHETFEAIYHKFQPRFRLNLNTVVYNRNRFQDLEADIRFLNAETLHLKNLNFNYEKASTGIAGTLRIPDPGKAQQEPLFIDLKANASGPISIFQKLFNIKLLDINAGEFNFSGKLTGNIQKFEQLLGNADGDLQLRNTRFYYPKAGIDLELDSLEIGVHNSNIELKPFVVEVEDHHPFSLQARVEQFPGFLLDSLESTGRILVEMQAPFINLDEWMETVNSLDTDTAGVARKKPNLNVVFEDINRFDPEFKLSIDSLRFADILSRDLHAKVYFENDSILKLDDLKIGYQDSEALIKGQLEAQNVKHANADQNPFNFDFSIAATGKSRDLNELLKTVNFVLGSGDFKFDMSYTGQARDLKIMNTSARGDLKFTKTRVEIDGTEIQFPVDSLHLKIENDLAFLKNLEIDLPGKSFLDITGQIDNFSSFINNEKTDDSHTSSFLVKSPYLDTHDITDLLGSNEKERDTTKKQNFEIRKLNQVLRNINRSYRPSAELLIDSLVFKNIRVSDFHSDIDYGQNGELRIGNTRLQYNKAHADLKLAANLEAPAGLPVEIEMNITDLDLKNLVKDLDYLDKQELRDTKKLRGKLDLLIELTGVLNDTGYVDMSTLNGSLKLDLRNLALHDFDPIMQKVVLLKEKRFERLEFRPIQQTFEIKNGLIKIPRTQVQSTALHFFIEGESRPGEYHNIWISLPWNNILKSRDGLELPPKLSFEDSGAKFYLQMVQDKKSDKERKQKLRTRFRLGNRKLEKQKKE